MGQIETDKTLAPATAGDACDITLPVPPDPKGDRAKAERDAAWHRHARYRVYRFDPITYEKTPLGAWLTYEEAKAWAASLEGAEDVWNPYRSNWNSPSYGFDLHLPTLVKGGAAAPGDLVIHEVIEPVRFELGGTSTDRQFYLVSLVTAVDTVGHVTAFTDCDGEHHRAPRKPWIMSATELHVEAALKGLQKREEEMRPYGLSFHGAKDAVHFLEQFIRHQAPIYPSLPDFGRDTRLEGKFAPRRMFARRGAAGGFTVFSYLRTAYGTEWDTPIPVEVSELEAPAPGGYFAWKRVDGAVLGVSTSIEGVKDAIGTQIEGEILAGYGVIVPVAVEAME